MDIPHTRGSAPDRQNIPPLHNEGDRTALDTTIPDEALRGTLPETSCGGGFVGSCEDGSHRPQNNPPVAEAQDRQLSCHSGNYDAVRRQGDIDQHLMDVGDPRGDSCSPKLLGQIINGTRRPKFNMDRSDPNLPTHIQKVGTLDWEGLQSNMNCDQRTKAKHLWRLLTEHPIVPMRSPFCEILPGDISRLLEADLIEPVDTEAVVTTSLFRCDERSKGRARLITWPKRANEIMSDPRSSFFYSPAFSLPDALDLTEELREDEWGFTDDLRISFYQVGLPPGDRHYVFEHLGRKYAMRVLPMGVRPAAELMQLITETIAQIAIAGLPVRHRSHIDNIKFTGTRQDVAVVKRNLQEAGKKYHITLHNDCAVTQQITFHGFEMNLKNRVYRRAAEAPTCTGGG